MPGGVAIGTFIAFTPTFGIQILLATVAATLFGGCVVGTVLAAAAYVATLQAVRAHRRRRSRRKGRNVAPLDGARR